LSDRDDTDINACGDPYNTVTAAIRVGATTITDAKATYSAFGSCIDVWAPGGDFTTFPNKGIVSDGIPNSKYPDCADICELAGTSAAAPFVAGAVAQVLARPGWANATPAQIKTEVSTHMVSTGVISGLYPASHNKLLYIPPPPVAGGSSIAVARNKDGRLGLFGITPAGDLLYRTQVSAGSTNWRGWTTSRNVGGWYSVAAQTDGRDRISLLALRRTPQNIWYRAQGQRDIDEGWTNLHQVAGLLNSVAVARSSAGRLELFGTNSAGQLWQSYKSTIAGVGDFTSWTQWPLPPGETARSVAAELNASNVVEVFTVTSAGQLWHPSLGDQPGRRPVV
jgi:subtilase family protein